MYILQYDSLYLKHCRALWAENVQRHRDIYNDQSIGGENPGNGFDQHLSSVGPDRIWLAKSGEEISGLISLIVNGQEAEVEPVIVNSDYRGKGVGKALIEHVITVADKIGVLCLSVKPVARNEQAITFFYNSGFRTLGHIQMFMWLGESTPDTWKKGPVLFGKSFDF